MLRTIFTIFSIIILVSCRQHQQVAAKIYERRQLAPNRLMIHFRYMVKDKAYTDSASVANVVINSDSISVIIDPANPGRAIPDFAK